MNSEMLMAIVMKGQAEGVMAAARAAGATGGTIAYARGTATSTIMAALGLGDSEKEVLTCFINEEDEKRITDSIASLRKMKGTMLCSGYGSGDGGMDSKWVLRVVICEEGYSEDIMAVARKAGARGGTVINAHGTSTEDDVKFFGSPLIPEKEILMVVLDASVADKVIDAVASMDILKQKGRAVMFTLPVHSFRNLG